MTLTPCDLALAAIAAPEPESRFTSRMTFAPLVIACSACCCCVDLSPSALVIVGSVPPSESAFCRSGRSTVSQRTDDFESGSSTATLGLLPPPPPPPPLLSLLSSPPHAATVPLKARTPAAASAQSLLCLDTSLSSSLGGWFSVLLHLTPPRSPRPSRRPRAPTA